MSRQAKTCPREYQRNIEVVIEIITAWSMAKLIRRVIIDKSTHGRQKEHPNSPILGVCYEN
jgi:hypothetical protein